MSSETQEPPASKPLFFQHPVAIKVLAFFHKVWLWIKNLWLVRFVVRIAKALGRMIGGQAMRVPVIRRGVGYAGEKMKVPLVRNMVYMLVICGCFFGAIFLYEALMAMLLGQLMASFGNMPQTVSTVQATTEPWQKTFKAVGSLRAEKGADLSSQQWGIVETITFKSGDDVDANTILLTLRAEDDIAKLASLKAVAELAEINYKRDQEQFKIQGVSKATLDTDSANLANDKALVAQQQAIVDYKVVRAPFAGRLGIRAVDIGQYLSAGTKIVTLQALDPIFMDFYMPQQQIASIKVGQPVTIRVDTFPGVDFPGKVSALNPLIDASSRNLQVRATVDNPEHKLLPGMYGTVSVNIGEPHNAVTLPQTVLTYNPYGSTVFLVKSNTPPPSWWQRLWGTKPEPDLTVAQEFVKTGDTRGDQVEILSGVKDGETVVGAGQMKIHNGSGIIVNNSVLPTNEATPVPKTEQ